MDNMLLFESRVLGGFYLRVYSDRIEFKDAKGSHVIFLTQLTGVSLPFLGGRVILIETTGGRQFKIVAKNKKEAFRVIQKSFLSAIKCNIDNQKESV